MIKVPKISYRLNMGISWIILFIISAIISGCNSKKDSLNVIFAGDLMLDRGTRHVIEVHGPDDLFGNVYHKLRSSDFTVANLECVACDTACQPVDKRFTFRANPEWLLSLYKNGITHVILANNHSCDFGDKGVKQTISNLIHVGITPIGASQNNDATSEPTIIEKGKDSMAVFSSCFLKQKFRSVSSENVTCLSEKIMAFKAMHPSYIILVCLHWGIEMDVRPSSEQVEQAHELIMAGADVIIGHHPHVVQTIEFYKGKYIFYSLGNFIFDNQHSRASRGILTDLFISKGRIISIQLIPFNILKSKPFIMNIEESETFRKEINGISKTFELKQKDGIWKVL